MQPVTTSREELGKAYVKQAGCPCGNLWLADSATAASSSTTQEQEGATGPSRARKTRSEQAGPFGESSPFFPANDTTTEGIATETLSAGVVERFRAATLKMKANMVADGEAYFSSIFLSEQQLCA